jgi:hypothetical protein
VELTEADLITGLSIKPSGSAHRIHGAPRQSEDVKSDIRPSAAEKQALRENVANQAGIEECEGRHSDQYRCDSRLNCQGSESIEQHRFVYRYVEPLNSVWLLGARLTTCLFQAKIGTPIGGVKQVLNRHYSPNIASSIEGCHIRPRLISVMTITNAMMTAAIPLSINELTLRASVLLENRLEAPSS